MTVIEVADSSLAYDRTTKLSVHRPVLTQLEPLRVNLVDVLLFVPRFADCRVESVEKFLE